MSSSNLPFNNHYRAKRNLARRGLLWVYRLIGKNPFLVAALLIAVAAAWPLMSEPGLLNSTRGGGDSPFLLQRLQQLETALKEGHFPVRWMPDANYGYGFPFYHYYAPLSFYIAAVFRFIGLSYVRAIQLTQLLGFITAAAGMFYLGRRWMESDWAGLLSSAAYTLTPFHMVNVYVRGDSLAEFWAMAFYPLVLLTVDDLVREKRKGETGRTQIALFGLSYGALILSHNISALIFSPFLLLYILIRWWRWRDTIVIPDEVKNYNPELSITASIPLLLNPLLGILLAFGLAAHFFLPALAEKSLAQLKPATAGHFYYANHFQGTDLIQSGFLFNYDPDGGVAFHTGLVQVVVAGIGIILMFIGIKKWLGNAETSSWSLVIIHNRLFVIATLLIATFMITPLSRPLWDQLPLLLFTQFPWRFLSVQSVALALATAVLALLPRRQIVVPGIILLLLVSSLGRLETTHLILTDADVTAEKIAQYEWFTGNIGTTVSAEYLPDTVQPRNYTSPWLTVGERNQIQPVSGELINAQRTTQRATRQSWQVTVGAAVDGAQATLTFPTMYWPGWRAMVDGGKSEIRPAPGSGLITLDLSPGEHQVQLQFGRTPIRLISELVSLAVVLLVGWMLWPEVKRRFSVQVVISTLSLLIILSIGLRLWPERELSPGDLSWDFAQMGYLHHSPDGIPFDNGMILKQYTFSQDELEAGETLTITLNWAGIPEGSFQDVTVALASPAVNRFEQAPLLVSQSQKLKEWTFSYQLVIPENAPGGLYVPRLTLTDSRALMSANRLRGNLFLRPLRVRDPLLQANLDEPPFAVQAIDVSQRDSTTLDLQLAWTTRQPLNQNYNVTLRLFDANGLLLTQFDTQPGFGFLPSIGWPAGHWVNDWLALTLPQPLPDAFPYKLMTQLYAVGTGELVLTRFLGNLVQQGGGIIFQPPEPVFTLPVELTPVDAQFMDNSGPIIELHGYEIERTGNQINLTLYWGAMEPGQFDYTRFVHLIDPSVDQPPIIQSDEMPRNGSYPTGQWVAREVVSDPVTLDLAGVPAGKYQIIVGLYRNLGNSFPRLTTVDASNNPLPNDHFPLPKIINVQEN